MARGNALGEGRVVLALTAKEADALMVTLEEAEIRPSVGPEMQRVYDALVAAITGWTPAHLAAMKENTLAE